MEKIESEVPLALLGGYFCFRGSSWEFRSNDQCEFGNMEKLEAAGVVKLQCKGTSGNAFWGGKFWHISPGTQRAYLIDKKRLCQYLEKY